MPNNRRNEQPDRFRVGDRAICYRRGRWWWMECYLGRRQRRQALETTSKKEARRRATLIEASMLNGSYRQAPPAKTVAEVVRLHGENLATGDRASGTVKRYTPVYQRWLSHLEKLGIKLITEVDLQAVEDYRSARRRQVAPATLHFESVLLLQLMNFAFDREFLVVNPLRKLKLKRPRTAKQPTFTLQEVERIIAAAGRYAAVYEVLAFAGLRVGEVRWLTWDDVELDEDGQGGFLYVRAKPGEWRPKDGDDRRVPVHPRVGKLLGSLPRRHRFVFTAAPSKRYPGGDHQVSDRHALAKLKQVIEQLGIPAGNLHAFRRFFISFAANNGVEPFKVMEWVGHSDIGTVLRYYSLGEDESRRAMAAVPFGDADETCANAGRKQAQIEHNSDAQRAG
ncbi:MAG: tyrosine-type recombinase/integrase [Planctomycetota bacterium]|jgi:integrase